MSFIANAVLYTGIKKLEVGMFVSSTEERAIIGKKSRKNNGIVYKPASTWFFEATPIAVKIDERNIIKGIHRH